MATKNPTLRRLAATAVLIEVERDNMTDNWTDQISLKRDSRSNFIAIAKKHCEDHMGRGLKRWIEIDRVGDLKTPAQIVAGLNRCAETIGIDLYWPDALAIVAKLDWCVAAVVSTQMGHDVPMLPKTADVAAQRSLQALGKVQVGAEWGYDLNEVNLPFEAWLNILQGKKVTVEAPYRYEGQPCHSWWCFDIKSEYQLHVSTDDGGDGWLGELAGIDIIRGPALEGVDLAKAALASAPRLIKLRTSV